MATIRRRVQVYGDNNPGVMSFGVVSFSREDQGIVHEVEIDLHTGICVCECEHARMSGVNSRRPSIEEDAVGERPCIHARRVLFEARKELQRRERESRRIER